MDCIDLVGEIMYVEGGQMTAVLACKSRDGDKQDVLRHFPDDHPKAFLYHGTNHSSERYSILTQYSGSFTVDDAQGSVTHTIGTSFHPRYVGKTLMRQAKFDVRDRMSVDTRFSIQRIQVEYLILEGRMGMFVQPTEGVIEWYRVITE